MDPASPSTRARPWLLLLLLSAALLLLRLGSVPLLGPDEPRYARVAVEMHRNGEWITPTLGGHVWMEKPVLYYWLAKPALSILGETEMAVRLPSVLAGVASVGLVFFVGLRLFGAASATWAGLVMATSLLPFVYARAAAMDALLAACVTGAIGLGGLRILGRAGRPVLILAYACAGLGTLAKGPLGVLLPGFVLTCYWLTRRRRDDLARVLSPAGLLACILVAAPWYLLILWHEGRAFIDVFILNHNLERFTSTIHRHPGPLVYYLPVLLVGLFPWTIVLPLALRRLQPRARLDHRLLLIWLCAPLAFFSAAGSKLPGYILPCLPPLALMAGDAIAGHLALRSPAPRRWLALGAALNLLVSLALGAAPFILREQGSAAWTALLPAAVWALGLGTLGLAWISSCRLLVLLRVGAPGMLALLALAAPPVLGPLESGRDLFARIPPQEEVLVVAASRSAWMSGYFYHDARVREAEGLEEVLRTASVGPVLLLCGEGEYRTLERLARPFEPDSAAPAATRRGARPRYGVELLGSGPHASRLLRITPRRAAPQASPPSSPR